MKTFSVEKLKSFSVDESKLIELKDLWESIYTSRKNIKESVQLSNKFNEEFDKLNDSEKDLLNALILNN